MITLLELHELISNSENQNDNSKSIDIVRHGLNLYNGDTEFWDNFIKICSDSESLGELLDVPSVKIDKWASKLQEIISIIKDMDNEKIKKDMIKTGKNTD